MPIYEYQCKKCNTVSEFLVLNDKETLQCKTCGGTQLMKLLSAPNMIQISGGRPAEPGQSCCGDPGSCGTPHSCGAPGSCCGK